MPVGGRVTGLICLLLAIPQPGWALDCLNLSAGQYIRSLANVGIPHRVVRGQMTLLPGQDRNPPLVDGARHLALQGTVTGQLLTREGYGEAVTLDVTERHFCHEPWCVDGAEWQVDSDQYFFVLRESRRGLFFESGMCAFEVFAADETVEAEVLACMRNQPECPPPQY